jgi:hypothetical protein
MVRKVGNGAFTPLLESLCRYAWRLFQEGESLAGLCPGSLVLGYSMMEGMEFSSRLVF